MKQYEHKTVCQWGESGVIEEIFRRIGTTNKMAVDIGAWDGKHFSNTWNLAANHGWSRLLVEQDHDRLYSGQPFPKDHLLRHTAHSLDTMLDTLDGIAALEILLAFDLLCIDIDGDDYYLWKDMVTYKPRVVVIEYNQTVPPHIDIVQERGGTFGASALALNKLARSKGYFCVHCTITNMIFVLDECVKQGLYVQVEPNTDWLQYVVTGYNGKQYKIGQPA